MNELDKNLSIVIQGGFFKNKADDIAAYLSQYRHNFPESEIIFSISTSDCVDLEKSNEQKLVAAVSTVRSACNVITKLSDKIVFCSEALALPPVKDGNPACNVNYQIEAAQRGLNEASREYVLRVRNDILFIDKTFLHQYERLNLIERGKYEYFSSRILISSLFTLNPYGAERFPFHFSDWFHFGKLSDVKKLWNIDFIDLDFATYGKYHPALEGSLYEERMFNFKTAVEQHIVFSVFKEVFPHLHLDRCNDLRSVDDSIHILLDNFIVVDPYKVNMYFPKYDNDFYTLKNNHVCIVQDKWEFLARNRDVNFREYLSVNYADKEEFVVDKLPFKFHMRHFSTEIGSYCEDKLVIPYSSPNGSILFGPNVQIPFGKYVVRVHVSETIGEKVRFVIAALAEQWKLVFMSYDVSITNVPANGFIVQFSFDVLSEKVKLFEVFMQKKSAFEMVIDSVEILNREDLPNSDENKLIIDIEKELSTKNNADIEVRDRIFLVKRDEFLNSFKLKLFFIFAKLFMKKKFYTKLKENTMLFFEDSRRSILRKFFAYYYK